MCVCLVFRGYNGTDIFLFKTLYSKNSLDASFLGQPNTISSLTTHHSVTFNFFQSLHSLIGLFMLEGINSNLICLCVQFFLLCFLVCKPKKYGNIKNTWSYMYITRCRSSRFTPLVTMKICYFIYIEFFFLSIFVG